MEAREARKERNRWVEHLQYLGRSYDAGFQTKTYSYFHRQQQRQVSKVLLDGLYDDESPLSMLHGSLRQDVMGEIIWKMLVAKWQVFPDQ